MVILYGYYMVIIWLMMLNELDDLETCQSGEILAID
jgi:hypothetical protein